MFANTINEPPYKLTDIMAEVGADINAKLRIVGKEVISKDVTSRYGYYTELLQNLTQENAPGFADKKYPFIWSVQPFTIIRGEIRDAYGYINNFRLFIVVDSEVDYKAAEREQKSFDPTLNPIYIQLLKSMKNNGKLRIPSLELFRHDITARYYWGEDQKQIIPDAADCIEVIFKKLIINNNINC